MDEKNTGGAAFPLREPLTSDNDGMTLRDYFAAKALQGICASGPGLEMLNSRIAAESYELADAMLAERAK